MMDQKMAAMVLMMELELMMVLVQTMVQELTMALEPMMVLALTMGQAQMEDLMMTLLMMVLMETSFQMGQGLLMIHLMTLVIILLLMADQLTDLLVQEEDSRKENQQCQSTTGLQSLELIIGLEWIYIRTRFWYLLMKPRLSSILPIIKNLNLKNTT